jgi:hypothetical protein
MSKKTDYKQLLKREQEKNKVLSDKLTNFFIPRLKMAEAVMIGVIYDEVDIDKLKSEYFKNNPDLREVKNESENANIK